MITEEIKLYDEPVPVWQGQTHHTTVKQETPAEREAWLTRCASELDKAKQIFGVGDKFCTKHNKTSTLMVVNFIEDVTRMQKYTGNPCVLEAKNITFVNTNIIQYSLEEIDLTNIIKLELPNV